MLLVPFKRVLYILYVNVTVTQLLFDVVHLTFFQLMLTNGCNIKVGHKGTGALLLLLRLSVVQS